MGAGRATLRLLACLAGALSLVVGAEIYRYVDPATGAVEFGATPKAGAVRVGTGQVITDVDAFNAQLVAESKAAAKARADAGRRVQDALAELAKKFPTACKPRGERAYCDPQPGMPIKLAQAAFGLRHVGYSHDASGRIERYRLSTCTILANDRVITAVSC